MTNLDKDIPGLFADGRREVTYWGSLVKGRCAGLYMAQVCPEWGTEVCLECDWGEQVPVENCDFNCWQCAHKVHCPCTLTAWTKRQRGV